MQPVASSTHTRLETIKSLATVSTGVWNALSGATSLYLSRDWLCAVENIPDTETSYLLASPLEGDSLSGALPLYAVQQEHNLSYHTDHILDGRLQGRYLLAGSRHGYENDVLVNPALNEHQADDVLRSLLDAADRRCADQDLDDVLFLYLTTEAVQKLMRARPTLEPCLMSFDMVLPLSTTSFDDHLNSLGTNRASRIRKEIEVFQRAGFDVAVERLDQCWEEAGPLVSNVQRRYGHDESPQACTQALAIQARHVNEHARVFTARRDGRLVALALYYSWRNTLFGRLVGFDYDLLADAREYFNLYFYEPLRAAFESRHRALHLGQSSYTAKLRRGAHPRPLWAVPLGGRRTNLDWRQWNAAAHEHWRHELGEAHDLAVPPNWT